MFLTVFGYLIRILIYNSTSDLFTSNYVIMFVNVVVRSQSQRYFLRNSTLGVYDKISFFIIVIIVILIIFERFRGRGEFRFWCRNSNRLEHFRSVPYHGYLDIQVSFSALRVDFNSF